ncbi:hypothetical protein WA577_000990 [Blastocystis sp. JDR]
MSCGDCLSSTRKCFLITLNMLLMIVGLVMAGATGYYCMQISKKIAYNTYIGCGLGLVTFLFPMFIVCGGYESRCYLIFNNIIMILLSIAELVAASFYFIPDKVDLVKKILDLPKEYYDWIDSHLAIVGIVGGSIVAVQLLTVIIGGVHANSAKKTKENDIEMPLTNQPPKRTYREKAIEKYDLERFRSE